MVQQVRAHEVYMQSYSFNVHCESKYLNGLEAVENFSPVSPQCRVGEAFQEITMEARSVVYELHYITFHFLKKHDIV